MRLRCCVCDEELIDGEMVRASVIVKYKFIPSKVSYALSVPTETEFVEHVDCPTLAG